MSQCAAAVGGTQRAAGQETILARGGVTTRNDASSHSHIHGEASSHSSPGTQVSGDCLWGLSLLAYLLIWFLLSHLLTLLVLAQSHA